MHTTGSVHLVLNYTSVFYHCYTSLDLLDIAACQRGGCAPVYFSRAATLSIRVFYNINNLINISFSFHLSTVRYCTRKPCPCDMSSICSWTAPAGMKANVDELLQKGNLGSLNFRGFCKITLPHMTACRFYIMYFSQVSQPKFRVSQQNWMKQQHQNTESINRKCLH